MELIKIGRDPRCDISITAPYISGLHAEIVIDDQGNMTIEDKNSSNGTVLNGTPLAPNIPTPLMRGDRVVFAETPKNPGIPLQWDRVPNPIKSAQYKRIINIGSSQTNDIIPGNDKTVSRYHAMLLIGKDGKTYIRDNGSRNGTLVDGQRINPRTPVRIKRGQQVVVGKTDITEAIKPFATGGVPAWLKYTGIGVGAAAVLCGIIFAALAIFKGGIGGPSMQDLQSGVVYVQAQAHYKVMFDKNKLPISEKAWQMVNDKDPYGTLTVPLSKQYRATAFFIDREGRLATNRHVAEPWASDYDRDSKAWISEVYHNILNSLPSRVTTDADVAALSESELGRMVIREAQLRGRFDSFTLASIVKALRNANPEVSGEIDYISVGYPGRNYTDASEFQHCFVEASSGKDDEDVAILRLNEKVTPDHVKFVFLPEKFNTTKLVPLEDDLAFIGYPALSTLVDKTIHSLTPETRSVKCSKEPGTKDFSFQGASGPGASGSPIFNKKTNELVGVLWGGTDNTDYGQAAQAKVLKKLYDELVNE